MFGVVFVIQPFSHLFFFRLTDQKVFNIVSIKKRKNSQTDGNIPDDMNIKLREMNIDPATAVTSMPEEHMLKLRDTLKSKKRIQVRSGSRVFSPRSQKSFRF